MLNSLLFGADGLYYDAEQLEKSGKYKEALKYYRRAFQGGKHKAAEKIAEIHYRTNTGEHDYAEALSWFIKGAEAGLDYCMYSASYMYLHGQGTDPDPEKALYWAEKCVKTENGADYRNHLQAVRKELQAWKTEEPLRNASAEELYELAYRFSKDSGQYDPERFLYWLKKAADAGNRQAALDLAMTMLDGFSANYDRSAGIEALKKLAEEGMWEAAWELVGIYRESDPAEAFHWLSLAWQNGAPQASYDLAEHYAKGTVCPEDPEKAFSLYLQACQENDPRAYFRTAMCLMTGNGCPEDRDAAAEYFRLALKVFDRDAVTFYVQALDRGVDLAKDMRFAYLVNRQLGEEGDVRAMKRCADLLAEKKMDSKLEDAFYWYEKGAQALYQAGSDEQWPIDGLTDWYLEHMEVPLSEEEETRIITSAVFEEKDHLAIAQLYAAALNGSLTAAKILSDLLIYVEQAQHFKYGHYLQSNRKTGVPEKLVSVLKMLAQAGDTESITLLAMCCLKGYGMETNEDTGMKLLEIAADRGDETAGKLYELMNSPAEETENFINRCREYSNSKDPAKLYQCSQWAPLAFGTPFGKAAGLYYLEQAVKAGNTQAMLEASDFYHDNIAVCDLNKSMAYAQQAGEHGRAEGYYKLALMYLEFSSKHFSKYAWQYFLLAEQGGYTEAIPFCSRLRSSNEQIFAEGKRLYEDAQYQDAYDTLFPLLFLNDTRAVTYCSDMILYDQVEIPSSEIIKQIFEKDYELAGNKSATQILCRIYADEKNEQKTILWGERAVRAGYPQCYSVIAGLYRPYVKEEKRSYAEWIKKGAEARVPECCYICASSYYTHELPLIITRGEAKDYALTALYGYL